jgi:hypothetical protein
MLMKIPEFGLKGEKVTEIIKMPTEKLRYLNMSLNIIRVIKGEMCGV